MRGSKEGEESGDAGDEERRETRGNGMKKGDEREIRGGEEERKLDGMRAGSYKRRNRIRRGRES